MLGRALRATTSTARLGSLRAGVMAPCFQSRAVSSFAAKPTRGNKATTEAAVINAAESSKPEYVDDPSVPHWNRIAKVPLLHEAMARAEAKGGPAPVISDHPQGEAWAPEGGPDKFAVCYINKRQFKVVAGDEVMVARLPDVDVGTTITLEKVLMVAGKKQTVMGQPLVPNTTVTAEVQEHCVCGDVIVFKFKRRKGYKKTKIHNTQATVLRIIDIQTTYDV